jgi:hypothetical protein
MLLVGLLKVQLEPSKDSTDGEAVTIGRKDSTKQVTTLKSIIAKTQFLARSFGRVDERTETSFILM